MKFNITTVILAVMFTILNTLNIQASIEFFEFIGHVCIDMLLVDIAVLMVTILVLVMWHYTDLIYNVFKKKDLV